VNSKLESGYFSYGFYSKQIKMVDFIFRGVEDVSPAVSAGHVTAEQTRLPLLVGVEQCLFTTTSEPKASFSSLASGRRARRVGFDRDLNRYICSDRLQYPLNTPISGYHYR